MSTIAKKMLQAATGPAALDPIEFIGVRTSTTTSISLSGLVQDGDLVVVAASSPYNYSLSWSGMTISTRYTAFYDNGAYSVYGFFGSGVWSTGNSTTLSSSFTLYPTIVAAVFRNVIDFEAANKSGYFLTGNPDPPIIYTPDGARLFITPAHAAFRTGSYSISTLTRPTGYTLASQVANSNYSRTAIAYKILEDPATSENPGAWGGAGQVGSFSGTSGFS